jgi:hypothetical protein
MNWINENFKKIIYIAFLVPILTVAFVSISHVTTWYGLSNPMEWAIYLSVGIEIAALSALAAISVKMGSKVYFPFGIVTLIQFIGNIFFSYQYIDIDSQSFKDWVDLVDPIVAYMGIESGDIIGHKRFLALFSGGMLPIISLSFLHMLVKFEEDKKEPVIVPNKDEIVKVERENENQIEEEQMSTKEDTEKNDIEFKNDIEEMETPIKQDIEKKDITINEISEESEPIIESQKISPELQDYIFNNESKFNSLVENPTYLVDNEKLVIKNKEGKKTLNYTRRDA